MINKYDLNNCQSLHASQVTPVVSTEGFQSVYLKISTSASYYAWHLRLTQFMKERMVITYGWFLGG